MGIAQERKMTLNSNEQTHKNYYNPKSSDDDTNVNSFVYTEILICLWDIYIKYINIIYI